MAVERSNLKVVFFPFVAQGHILPMVDMAKLFASRGVKSVILTTPANAASIQASLTSSNDSYPHPVDLHLIPFPSADAGLPDGCENVSSVPSSLLFDKFFQATSLLQKPFEAAVRSLAPDCVVSDKFFPWTLDATSQLDVPRLVFDGFSFFSSCVTHVLDQHRIQRNGEEEPFIIEGIPHRIEMLRSQDWHENCLPALKEIMRVAVETDQKSHGTVVNSFYELEPEYAQLYRSAIGRAWHIGPLALTRATAPAAQNECLSWLDRGRSRGSVVYVSFGSVGRFGDAQMREIALGLEAAGRPFIWVVQKEGIEWLPEGFEHRIGDKGLIFRGWAPQMAILNHQAVGAFVTHCGWNSCLEGIAAGLPFVTWPMFADQFYNEMLIVSVLNIGVGTGTKDYELESNVKVTVERGKLAEAVDQVMGEGEEAEERRRRARNLGELAKRAVEVGGSSDVDLSNLITELLEIRSRSHKPEPLHLGLL